MALACPLNLAIIQFSSPASPGFQSTKANRPRTQLRLRIRDLRSQATAHLLPRGTTRGTPPTNTQVCTQASTQVRTQASTTQVRTQASTRARTRTKTQARSNIPGTLRTSTQNRTRTIIRDTNRAITPAPKTTSTRLSNLSTPPLNRPLRLFKTKGGALSWLPDRLTQP